jgi:hypothetical protein
MKTQIKSLIEFLSLIIILSGCSKKTKDEHIQTIKLEPTESKNLVLDKSRLEIIKLETTEKSMLRNIQKAFIDFENDRIFILSGFNMYLFSAKGKYISKLNFGRGPGEILQLSSFTVDKKNKTVCVLDMARNLSFYNYSGNFIKRNQLQSFYSMDVFYKDEKNLFLVCKYVGGKEKFYTGNYNIKENKITKKFIPSKKSPYPISTNLIMPNGFSFMDNKLLFFTPSIFGLFEYENDDFHQLFSFDIGTKMVPPDLAKKYLLNNRSAFRKETKRRNYIPQLLFSFYFQGFYFIGVDDEKYTCYAINKTSPQVIYQNGTLSSYFKLPELKSLRLPVGLQKNFIVMVCNPSDLFDKKTKESSKTIKLHDKSISININDNPFLLVLSQ